MPFGLLTAYYLQEQPGKGGAPQGKIPRFSTSISNEPIKVDNLGMGITAPANIHHWVGYVSVGYE